jgi:hypothetical protein
MNTFLSSPVATEAYLQGRISFAQNHFGPKGKLVAAHLIQRVARCFDWTGKVVMGSESCLRARVFGHAGKEITRAN